MCERPPGISRLIQTVDVLLSLGYKLNFYVLGKGERNLLDSLKRNRKEPECLLEVISRKEDMMTKRFSIFLVLAALLVLPGVPASAGTCFGGYRSGSPCTYSFDCPGACSGGRYSGFMCSSNFECGGSCQGGPYFGLPCNGSNECGANCLGGTNSGLPCSGVWDCPGGSCQQYACAQHSCQRGYCF